MRCRLFPPNVVDRVADVPMIPRCGACGLSKGCRSPKMEPTGEGLEKVLVVAEAPGEDEDEEGTQLVGRAGRRLRKTLRGCGIDLDRDCWKTNALTCHPQGAAPTDKRILSCRPNLMRTIRELRPEVVILLGAVAVKSLVGHVWREDVGKIGRWVGWRIPCQRPNAWICPTWHPAYLLREDDPVLDLWFERHLKAAFRLEGRPWDAPPDYDRNVQLHMDVGMVSDFVNVWMDEHGDDPVAFDYETTTLKPDGSAAEIVSCSLAWRAANGVRAMAYPWVGEAVKATGKLLRSRVPKIAANMKFEDRWTRKTFGYRVRNWVWDTMQAAHVLDNRRGITSLSFQSFVKLGQGDYGVGIAPFLKSGGSNEPNRIREVELADLLRYNAMDSLCTYRIAEIQRGEMGYGS